MKDTKRHLLVAQNRMRSYENETDFHRIVSLLDALETLTLCQYMQKPLKDLLACIDEDMQDAPPDHTMLEIALKNAMCTYSLSSAEFRALDVRQCFFCEKSKIYHLLLAKLPDSTTGIGVTVGSDYIDIMYCDAEFYLNTETDMTHTLPYRQVGDCIDYLQNYLSTNIA